MGIDLVDLFYRFINSSMQVCNSMIKCLYDGIGRHARLKTLSFLGPGSSPGVGKTLHTVFIQF